MREIHINISVPDDSDIDSVVINLKHRGEPKECNNRPQKNNHKFNVPAKKDFQKSLTRVCCTMNCIEVAVLNSDSNNTPIWLPYRVIHKSRKDK